MGLFDFLKSRPRRNLYSGGDGESVERAVIVNATSSAIGIPAEYEFVTSKLGR
jgi:hypothetical protein